MPVAEMPMVLNDAGVIGFSLNGKSFPATEPLVVGLDDWFVVHYYNEGLQIHPMHLHGFPQLVFSKDGYPLDSPYWVDTLNVAPGERYSVLVHADAAGAWVWHCHILNHVEREEGMFGMVTAVIVEAEVMLVYYYGHVNGTLEQVSSAISAAEGEVSAWARLAYRKGEELRTRIDPGSFHARQGGRDRSGAPDGPIGVGHHSHGLEGNRRRCPVPGDERRPRPPATRTRTWCEVIFRGSYEPPLGGSGSPPRPGGSASSGRGERQGLPGPIVPGGRGGNRLKWAEGPGQWFRGRAGYGGWCRLQPFQPGCAGWIAPTRTRRKQDRSLSRCR